MISQTKLKAYGQTVADACELMGLSLREAGKLCGVSHSTMARVQAGNRPSLDAYLLINRGLHLKLAGDELLS